MAHISGDRGSQNVPEPGWKRTAPAWSDGDRTGRGYCFYPDGGGDSSPGDERHSYRNGTGYRRNSFDTGAYASRQSFITGTAVKQCAEQLRDKILAYAKTLLPEEETRELSLDHGWIFAGDEEAISLEALAQECYYSLTNSSVITAEVSTQVKKEYHCYRMLLCRGGGGSEAWNDQNPGYCQCP